MTLNSSNCFSTPYRRGIRRHSYSSLLIAKQLQGQTTYHVLFRIFSSRKIPMHICRNSCDPPLFSSVFDSLIPSPIYTCAKQFSKVAKMGDAKCLQFAVKVEACKIDVSYSKKTCEPYYISF